MNHLTPIDWFAIVCCCVALVLIVYETNDHE